MSIEEQIYVEHAVPKELENEWLRNFDFETELEFMIKCYSSSASGNGR